MKNKSDIKKDIIYAKVVYEHKVEKSKSGPEIQKMESVPMIPSRRLPTFKGLCC